MPSRISWSCPEVCRQGLLERCELVHPQPNRSSTIYRELSPGSPSSGNSSTQFVKGPHAKGFIGKKRWAYPNTGRAALDQTPVRYSSEATRVSGGHSVFTSEIEKLLKRM